jgi:hypothetical protein
MKYRASVANKACSWRSSLKEACRDLFYRLQDLRASGLPVAPILHNDAFIEQEDDSRMSAFEVFSLAMEEEWVVDGEWRE